MDALTEKCVYIVLRSFSSLRFFLFFTPFSISYSFVIGYNEIYDPTDLHAPDVCHRQSSFECCEDDIVESDG